MSMKELRESLNEVFRYGYGGLFAFLVAAIIAPNETKTTIKALGSVLPGLIAFAMGSAIYVFYRNLLGDFIVLPLVHYIHKTIDDRQGRTGEQVSCKMAYVFNKYSRHFDLGSHRLFTGQRVFRMLRDRGIAFPEDMRARFEIAHSELHLIYITFFVCLGGAVAYAIIKENYYSLWASVPATLAILVVGVFGDIRLNKRECDQLKNMDAGQEKRAMDAIGQVWPARPSNS